MRQFGAGALGQTWPAPTEAVSANIALALNMTAAAVVRR
jgi:hypothetical protein